MNLRTINIYVPGILTFPGDARNWCGAAVTYTHLHSNIRAEKVEYLSGPGITRSLFQQRRAQKLACTMSPYFASGWAVRLIGHSNGCDVILDALQLVDRMAIEQLHLVCGACEADFNRNGLNAALRDRQVEKVFVYIAGRDRALQLARSWIGHLFGFGTLGLHGARNVDPVVVGQVGELEWSEFGHSDCWSNASFATTVNHFLR